MLKPSVKNRKMESAYGFAPNHQEKNKEPGIIIESRKSARKRISSRVRIEYQKSKKKGKIKNIIRKEGAKNVNQNRTGRQS